MRHLLLAAGLCLATAPSLSGCATGDAIAGGTAGNGGNGAGNGGASGDGGETGDGGESSSRTSGSGSTSVSSTSGPGSTATIASSSASTGTPCSEDPCKLVEPQCGCGIGEKCSVDAGGRVCEEAGTRTPGQACGNGIGECEAGSVCVVVFETDDTLSCSRFCSSDLQCDGQGGLCAVGLGGAEDAKLCSDNCDVVSSSGCAIAGTKCGIYFDQTDMRYFSSCVGAGAGVAQSECNDQTNECAPGFECLQTQEEGEVFRCFEWCSSAASECTGDLTCQTDFTPPIVIGAVTYGICSG